LFQNKFTSKNVFWSNEQIINLFSAMTEKQQLNPVPFSLDKQKAAQKN
jgi:hypothetical protein